MKTEIPYSIGEVIMLVVSVLIGTLAFLAFMAISKKRRVTILFAVLILFINLFVTHVFTEILKLTSWQNFKNVLQPLFAYCGLYVLEWFDKRSFRIFDSASKKLGLDASDNNNENEKDNLKSE